LVEKSSLKRALQGRNHGLETVPLFTIMKLRC